MDLLKTKALMLMCGLPGSGKSTYIDKNLLYPGTQVVCADAVRLALGQKFNPAIEPVVRVMCHTFTRAFMEKGYDIVVDETNTTTFSLSPYIKMAKDYGYHTSLYHIITDKEICLARRVKSDPDYPWKEVISRMDENLKKNLETIKGMVDVYYALS